MNSAFNHFGDFGVLFDGDINDKHQIHHFSAASLTLLTV